MTRRFLLLLTLASCATATRAVTPASMPPPRALPRDARTIALGPQELKVEAEVSAMATYTIRFPRVAGTLVYSATDLEASRLEVAIDMSSLESSLAVVVDVASSSDFLDTARFPSARFTSHSLRKAAGANELHVFGELELHGQRRPVQVPAVFREEPCTITVHTEFSLNRREYGIESDGSLDDVVDDDVAVRIDARVPREPRGKGCPASAPRTLPAAR